MDMSRTRTIEPNRHGRDLVVGDVHGCFGTLERALAALRFDAACDRLFGVGDLVARGPRSAEAVDWLERRFEAVVLGNHDRAALDWFSANLRGSQEQPFGWIGVIDPQEYRRWLKALQRMPLALTVETAHGPVGVVHAETPDPAWARAIALLEQHSDSDIDNALLGFDESASAARQRRCQPVDGLRALVSGHFVVESVAMTANRWNIDTGAGFADRNHLSLLEVNAPELLSFTFPVVDV